jgi:hypothetical protein
MLCTIPVKFSAVPVILIIPSFSSYWILALTFVLVVVDNSLPTTANKNYIK